MKTILVPTDFSEKSDRAAAYGLGLAAALGTDLLLYNAFYIPHAEMTGTGMSPPFLVDYDLYERLSTSSLQKQAAALQAEPGGPAVRYANSPVALGPGIRRILEEEDILMIVMGNKGGEALMHFIYGSDTAEVVRRATCPVLMVPPDVIFRPLSRIAFAADRFDGRVRDALRYLTRLAAPFAAEIAVTHVFAPDGSGSEVRRYEEAYRESASALEYQRVTFTALRGDDVSGTLLQFTAAEDCDLIALVHRSHTLYEQVFEESVSRKVMGRHRIPYIIFPEQF